jgi:hypothetical protein
MDDRQIWNSGRLEFPSDFIVEATCHEKFQVAALLRVVPGVVEFTQGRGELAPFIVLATIVLEKDFIRVRLKRLLGSQLPLCAGRL